MITLQIDVTKIDKSRLFKGKKGTYLNVILIETPNSQYGDYMVKQQVSKEEREKGIEIILGSGKDFKPNTQENPSNQDNNPGGQDEDNLPF